MESNNKTDSDCKFKKLRNLKKHSRFKRWFEGRKSSCIILISILCLMIILSEVSCVLVYQLRLIAGKSGRSDYALAGESIELSCHYMMKDEAEEVKQLVWSKDGKNFLRWRRSQPGLDVLSYTFKGHIDPVSKHSHIIIHNVTIDMHGKYKCSIKTDLGTHELEQELIVISQSNCKLNDWRVTSQPSKCREVFNLNCRNMFPKPVPSCGLWNDKSDKFIRAVMVDISEEPNKQTYRVRYSDKFDLPQQQTLMTTSNNNNGSSLDLLQYAGHLLFKCDIIVPETSWKLSLVHKMFDYNDGCQQDPLETIERMRHNYSQYATNRMQQAGYLLDRRPNEVEMLASNLKYELLHPDKSKHSKVELDCWRKPKVGSLARLSCAASNNQINLIGANLLECKPNGWVPVAESNVNLKSVTQRNRRPQRPSRRIDNSNDPEVSTSSRISLDESNDLNEETTQITTTAIAAITTTTSPEFDIIPTTQEILNLATDSSVETTGKLASEVNLSPSQLASLLPTCISTRRRSHSTMISSNRLPLLDEAHVLESSSSTGDSNSHRREGNQRKTLSNLSSSGSTSIHTLDSKHITVLALLLGVSIVLAASRLHSFQYVSTRTTITTSGEKFQDKVNSMTTSKRFCKRKTKTEMVS